MVDVGNGYKDFTEGRKRQMAMCPLLSECRVVRLVWERGRDSSQEKRWVGYSLTPVEDHEFTSSLLLFFGWTMVAS